jgi:N-acetylmuramoyl-L-alanine amidase
MESKIFSRTIIYKFLISLFLVLTSSNLLFAGNNFVKSQIRQAELKLYFSSDIERVTYFTIPAKDGVTKYIYDIYGAVLPSKKGISHHTFRSIKSFRIAQNSPTKLRVIIQSKEKALDKQQFKGKVLAIPLISGQKSTIASNDNSTSKVNSSVKKRYTRPYVVVIDAGHGGKDTGAICCGDKKEKKVTLSVAGKLKKKLEAKGYKVYMTRSEDTFVKLPTRTAFANKKKADIFVSIHANAAPSKNLRNGFEGIEIYYLSPAKTQRAKEAAAKENAVMFTGKDYYTKNAYLSLISREKIVESHKLGLDVSEKMLKYVRKHFGNVANGGVKTANFWVLVGAQMPAILVETGYITHPKEGKNLMNNYYKELLAKGIADGVERYLKNK